MTSFRASVLPVLAIVLGILAVWYAGVVPMNRVVAEPFVARTDGSFGERLRVSMSLEKPVLPAPHQVVGELWRSIVATPVTREVAGAQVFNNRNLLFHVWTTLSSTLVGFAIGASLGVLLAVGIVHVAVLRLSLMPWVIASQTIPILAIAPIVIVGLGSVGITGLVPKAVISAYLSFFPVTIGMVKGLTSPEAMQMDLMRTYSAAPAQTFFKLRLPASMPFLFASLKVAVAISLVGAIVGELPTGAQAGLGARLLSGSYYGQMVQIWAALFAAAMVAALLVFAVSAVERVTLRRMGARPA
jgi:NitT/TauT family transport system permease protein